MDETSNLKLPYILAAQSQKHVTHNEAIRALDALVQLAVADKDLTAPPGSPDEGDRYIVGAGPTGSWSGQAKKIAAFQDSAWAFFTPLEGWLTWVADEDALYVFDGASWIAAPGGGGGGGGSVNPTSLVGVNATADATNRLSVSSPASLFDHEGAGHQLKLNKAAAGDTGSLLFQTGYSGRAEFGLTGDDDFHVKVSPDGSTWHDAIVVSRSSGAARVTGLREALSANRTYYVRTDGSDTNTGLANTSGGAFLTIQKAVDVVSGLDIAGFTVTIQIADGTYSPGSVINLKNVVGFAAPGNLIIQGNNSTPANVILTRGFSASHLSSVWDIKDLKLAVTGQGLNAVASTIRFGNLDFGTCTSAHIAVSNKGSVLAIGNYAISGGATAHINSLGISFVDVSARTITISNTPAFSSAFCITNYASLTWIFTMTFSGTGATGTRYSVSQNGIIFTNGGGASYLPGSVAGTTATQGQYL